MQTLAQLRAEIDEVEQYPSGYSYYLKQVHIVPDAEVVHRENFILGKCIDKVVLDIGCHGSTLHQDIKKVAKETFGIDKQGEDHEGFWRIDIELDPAFPILIREVSTKMTSFPDIVICGEILEHLSNPGFFLDHLKIFDCEILFSVPNAFAKYEEYFVKQNRENVNIEHVAWYSYRTFRTLIERHGYKVKEFYWSDTRDADPGFSEGLIFIIQSGGKNG